MKINIHDSVAPDSMGDGWQDCANAAAAFAAHMEACYADVVRELYPDSDIRVDVDTDHGNLHGVSVFVDDCDDYETTVAIENAIEGLANVEWEKWSMDHGDDY